MKRSSNYDFFKKSPNNNFKEKSLKDKFKTIWKFIRVIIYFCLAGLALTGCIQSFVLKTSSTVGSGVELYNSENDVAPYVNNYKIENVDAKINLYYHAQENPSHIKNGKDVCHDPNKVGQVVLDEKGNPLYQEINRQQLKPLLKENYLVSDKTINELKKELNESYNEIGNKYGAYDNYSSSLRIVGINNEKVSDTTRSLYGSNLNEELVKGSLNNKFLFMNNKILDELSKKGQKYEIANQWEDINFFAIKKPENINSLSDNEKKIYGKGITNINSAFQAFEQANGSWNPVLMRAGKYVTYDANGDGINDSTELVEITDVERINRFKYAFDAEVVSLSKNEDGLFNSEMYARDFLQSILNVTIQFQQLNPFFEEFLGVNVNDSESRFKAASKANLEGKMQAHIPDFVTNQKVDPNKLLSIQQKNAILAYQNEIFSTINKLGFGIKNQIYDDGSSEDSANWNTPYKVEYMPQINDKKGLLIGSAPIGQKAIYSWGGAWELGPFYGLVVWPLSYIMNGISGSMPPMNGWAAIIAIVLAILISRVFTTLLTYKSIFASHKQQELQPKKAKIDAKYEGFKGNRQMEAKKRQEISDLYKKYNVSMSAPLLSMLITIPIFLAVWRVVQGIPDIKSATWLGIQLSATSWRELFNGSWQYLPLLLVAIIVQIASNILPRYLNRKRLGERINVAEKAALKKANKTQNIMMIVFVVMAVIFEAGVQIYWIVGGLWQIGQILLVHHIVKTDFYKNKLSKYM